MMNISSKQIGMKPFFSLNERGSFSIMNENRLNSENRRLKAMVSSPFARWIRARLGASEGGALVEFAMVLPMMLAVMTGIFTFGIALNNYLELTNGVSIGARYLAISRGNTLDPCATVVNAVYGAAPNLKTANFSFTTTLNGTSYNGTSCSSSTTTTGAAGNLVQGTSATVTATYPCNLSVYGVSFAGSCTLKSTVTELVQ
jgi:Flp pilus assembly protein TadG